MNRLIKYFSFVLLPMALMMGGCKTDSSPGAQEEEKTAPARSLAVPSFDRDSAYHYVEKQLAFGPRVPNSEAHQAAKEWLVEQFRRFGAEVIEQDFQAETYYGATLKATNIIAQFNPQAGKRILLGAHWDTRYIADSPLSVEGKEDPVPGADDGASGVAVLLEVARQLHANPPDIGVDMVLFDAEDQGESGADNEESWGLGSQYWARNLHRGGYNPKYGILLDMVGAKDARFLQEAYSKYFAPALVEKVWKLAQDMGYGNYFVSSNGGAVTDDHYFVNTIAGIKMINIINQAGSSKGNFGAHWHTQQDDLDIIDPRTLKAAGQVVLAILYRENNRTF